MTITYNTASPYRISRIEESNGSTLGARLDFSYGLNRTDVTDVQGRTAQYQFNDSGNTVCVISPDGSAQYTSFGKNINGATSNDINKLTLVSKTQKFSNNFLQNHNLETDSSWILESGGGSTGTHTYDTAQKYLGSRSIKLFNNGTGWQAAYQNLSLTKGKTYTFSGYIKTDTSSGAYLKAIYYNSSNSTTIQLYGQMETGTQDWTRYSVTFTIPSDAYKCIACLWRNQMKIGSANNFKKGEIE